MKRKSMRVLALVLAFVMLVSASCVTAFAKKADYKTPYTDENGKFYFTYEQSATYVMDLIDELLSTVNNGKNLKIDLKVKTFTLTLQNYDTALQSVYDFRNSTLISLAISLGVAGDLDDLNVSRLSGYIRRTDATNYDYNCLYNVVGFLWDNNEKVLCKIVDGSFGWGLIDDFVDFPPLITNLTGWLSDLIYVKLEELTGREFAEGESYTVDIDAALNDLLLWLFNDKIGDLLNFEGGLNLTLADVNIKTVSLYDMVNNVIESALHNMVVPLLKKVLLDAFGIETSDAYPNGTEAEMNNSTMVMVLGIVEDLLQNAQTHPDYSNCRYPGEKIETLLTWFFLEGGMNEFITIDQQGITIQQGLIDLLDSIIRLAIPLVYGLGMDYLPPSLIYSSDDLAIEEGQEGYITNKACYAQLVNILLSNLVQGYYCNPRADSIAEVGAYCLASLCARICPDINYIDQLDANYAAEDGETYYDWEGNAVTPLPFVSNYTFTGQYLNGSTWVDYTATYAIPYAAVDMGVTVGKYFLDGLTTANFDAVPDTGAATATVRFEKFFKVLVDWVIDKYVPLFNNAYGIKDSNGNPLKYSSYTDVWKLLDEVLFGLLPTSWLPASITDYTMDAEYDTKGRNGAATFQIKSSGDLICGWLLGSVMDFDLRELVSIFRRNTSSGAELNNPTLTVLLRVVDRVLYIALSKYAILPANAGSRNPYGTATSITSLGSGSNGLTNKTNFTNLVKYLIYGLGGGSSSSFNINTKTVPLLKTVLPLLLSSDYVKPYRTNILQSGQITVADLEALINKINQQGSIIIPYAQADVDETTTGTYYYVDSTNTVQTVVLDGNNFDPTKTYYKEQYVRAQDIDRYTNSAKYNNGYGVYVATEDYRTVTLDGSNYDPNQTYYSTDFIVATVTPSTNGKFFTSQSASSGVTLPDQYSASATYYTHPEALPGASGTGNYLIKTVSYSPVTLNGTGTNYNENKDYYKKAVSNVSFGYMDTYNPETHKLAMGIYSAAGAQNGVGTYSTSISGQDFYVYREQEDFPTAMFDYNNFNDFIEDAQDFIGSYKSFIEDMKDAADAWKAYFAGGESTPSDFYPFYSSNPDVYDRRVGEQGVTNAQFNGLQAIVDFKAEYGASAFITSSTTNTHGDGNATPLATLPTADNAGTTDTQKEIYKAWNKYCQEVVKYSNNLNNYYDGINYYLSTAEQGRKSYTATTTDALEWVIHTLCDDAYNNGQNGTADPVTGVITPAYTEKTYRAFKAAYECAVDLIAQAKQPMASAKTTQSMITKARTGLIEAFYNLIEAGALADKLALYNAMVAARRLLNDSALYDTYTAASIQNLVTVLQSASNLFDEVVTLDEQQRVDLQTSRLIGAMNLVYLLAPDLQILSNYTGSIAIADRWVQQNANKGYIYGLPVGVGLTFDDAVFEVVGINRANADITNTSYGNGTGTKIAANDGGINKFEFYAVVFGDVNGDARIDGTDKLYIEAKAINAANTGNLSADYYGGSYVEAADIDGDGEITATDAQYVNMVVNYEATINQASGVQGSRVELV
ncbi:MAG: hypothetical protein J5562_00110 [Clostridia bacterium]|nr:hypothetical protein [Clostridia bacterium]